MVRRLHTEDAIGPDVAEILGLWDRHCVFCVLCCVTGTQAGKLRVREAMCKVNAGKCDETGSRSVCERQEIQPKLKQLSRYREPLSSFFGSPVVKRYSCNVIQGFLAGSVIETKGVLVLDIPGEPRLDPPCRQQCGDIPHVEMWGAEVEIFIPSHV